MLRELTSESTVQKCIPEDVPWATPHMCLSLRGESLFIPTLRVCTRDNLIDAHEQDDLSYIKVGRMEVGDVWAQNSVILRRGNTCA